MAGAAFGDSALAVFASVTARGADREQNVANAYSKECDQCVLCRCYSQLQIISRRKITGHNAPLHVFSLE